MMSRAMFNFLVASVCLLAITTQVQGSCSQFGHSCFGAHGKRTGEQYPALESAPIYQGNQLTPAEVKAQEEVLFPEEAPAGPSNREIITEVRNLLSLLGQRLRKRSFPSSSSAQGYNFPN